MLTQILALEPWDMAMQFLIPVMSMMSVGFAQLECLQKWKARKYAPIIGLAVQPCWLYTAVLHGQIGIIITGVFFIALWLRGLYEQWIVPLKSRSLV